MEILMQTETEKMLTDPTRAKVKILLVDDLKNNLLALEGLLRREDIEIFQAKSGTEALELMVLHEFAVALIDVHMPEMNGFELAELMRGTKRTLNIPIIFVTAAAVEQRFAFKGYESGAVDFLLKPLDPHAVKSKVSVFIEIYQQKIELKNQLETIIQNQKELAISQARLFQAAKLVTLGEMAAGMAHEMNQPLAGITLAIQTVKKLKEKNLLNDEELKNAFSDILTSVTRCTKVISHVRAFARQEKLDFKELNLNETLEASFNLMAEQLRINGIEITKDLGLGLPLVLGEPFQLEQVWINALTNCRDAMEEMEKACDGHYTKTLKVTSKLTDEGKYVLVEISDNGIGMSEEVLKKVFEPFFTTKEVGKGMGLGMSISHGILESHHAKIEIKSEPKKGTTLSVRFLSNVIQVQRIHLTSNPPLSPRTKI